MNTVPFEVIPLTETSYAVFREGLERIIANPETAFFMVGDAEETIIRSVLGAMSQGGDAFGERIDGLSEYELNIVYDAVRDASDGLTHEEA